MRGRGERRRRAGLSLFEAVAGLAIVGMTALAALGAAGAQLRVTERSRRAVEVAALAESRLHQLDLLTANELDALPDSVAAGTFDPPLGAYQWHTSVSHRDVEQGVYDVAVRIDWDGGTYAIHSALHRRPLIIQQ